MQYLGALIDIFHALLMTAWIVGLPLLFWHRYPKVSISYAFFSLAFIVVNQLSHYLLGECVLTTIATFFWQKGNVNSPHEWFSVRLAYSIFGLTPTHNGIKLVTKILITIATVGGMFLLFRKRKICQID